MYYLYGSREAIRGILTQSSTRKKGTVPVTYVEKLAYYRSSELANYVHLPGGPTDEQTKAIRVIVGDFIKHQRSSCMVIGQPGTGKSSLAEFLWVELSKITGCAPQIVKGISLTMVGLYTEDMIQPSARPLILVLNEIDASFKRAAQADEPKDQKPGASAESSCTSLASTSATLRDWLDRMAHTTHVIIIGTTNNINIRTEYEANTRPGRFDRFFTFTQRIVPKTHDEKQN